MSATGKIGTGSSALIQKLMDAEMDAEEIVRRAKENRILKLKEAQISAEEELKAFREKEEAQFESEFKNLSVEDSVDQTLEKSTEEAIEIVKNDFKNNGGMVADLILKKVLSVDLSLPPTVTHLAKIGKIH
ncbi:Vacuolar (H+)-ATPase G subunit family protein [Cryptosporidium meleagridis]|uniref:Vacuolar (H+)-ATPase G subunit family protein n=1 Tax=Cryptosporidium meleagridis TaxID=93969 RepID=A0A2P4Z131_9CRYT|nr:Vacuolar (H+)-ATPase G subunit family protein [Cryptosporidium meleagridis]